MDLTSLDWGGKIAQQTVKNSRIIQKGYNLFLIHWLLSTLQRADEGKLQQNLPLITGCTSVSDHTNNPHRFNSNILSKRNS